MTNQIGIPAGWRHISTEIKSPVVRQILAARGTLVRYMVVAAAGHRPIETDAQGNCINFAYAQAGDAAKAARQADRAIRRALVATVSGVYDVTCGF